MTERMKKEKNFGKIFYNKLVRDGIPKKIKQNGEECVVRTIEDKQEFQQELLKKVTEEAGALSRARSREEFLDEYADLMVVLTALERTLELSPAEIKLAIEENVEKKGKYDEQLFLQWSEDSDYESNETPQGVRKTE